MEVIADQLRKYTSLEMARACGWMIVVPEELGYFLGSLSERIELFKPEIALVYDLLNSHSFQSSFCSYNHDKRQRFIHAVESNLGVLKTHIQSKPLEEEISAFQEKLNGSIMLLKLHS